MRLADYTKMVSKNYPNDPDLCKTMMYLIRNGAMDGSIFPRDALEYIEKGAGGQGGGRVCVTEAIVEEALSSAVEQAEGQGIGLEGSSEEEEELVDRILEVIEAVTQVVEEEASLVLGEEGTAGEEGPSLEEEAEEVIMITVRVVQM